MSDMTSTATELQIKCILQDSDGERTSRTLTVDNPNLSNPNIRNSMMGLKQDLVYGKLAKMIQRANWRDTNGDERALDTVDVEYTVVTTTKLQLDLPDETAFQDFKTKTAAAWVSQYDDNQEIYFGQLYSPMLEAKSVTIELGLANVTDFQFLTYGGIPARGVYNLNLTNLVGEIATGGNDTVTGTLRAYDGEGNVLATQQITITDATAGTVVTKTLSLPVSA